MSKLATFENPEINPRSKKEKQQQTQPTYDAGSGNRTRADDFPYRPFLFFRHIMRLDDFGQFILVFIDALNDLVRPDV